MRQPPIGDCLAYFPALVQKPERVLPGRNMYGRRSVHRLPPVAAEKRVEIVNYGRMRIANYLLERTIFDFSSKRFFHLPIFYYIRKAS